MTTILKFPGYPLQFCLLIKHNMSVTINRHKTTFFFWQVHVLLGIWMCLCDTVHSFYVPGVAPVEFKIGDNVDVKVR